MRYVVSADDARRFGLPCGGTLELLLEFNPDPDIDIDSLADLVRALSNGQMAQRSIDVAAGRVVLQEIDQPDTQRTKNCERSAPFIDRRTCRRQKQQATTRYPTTMGMRLQTWTTRR